MLFIAQQIDYLRKNHSNISSFIFNMIIIQQRRGLSFYLAVERVTCLAVTFV